jgi:hypothetical protein
MSFAHDLIRLKRCIFIAVNVGEGTVRSVGDKLALHDLLWDQESVRGACKWDIESESVLQKL